MKRKFVPVFCVVAVFPKFEQNLKTAGFRTNHVVSQTFFLIKNWLQVARNFMLVRKTFFCNEEIESTALNIIVNKETHDIGSYENPSKSPCDFAKKFLNLDSQNIFLWKFVTICFSYC